MEKFVILLAIIGAKGMETQVGKKWVITQDTPDEVIRDMVTTATMNGFYLEVEEVPADMAIKNRIEAKLSRVAEEMGYRPITDIWCECWYKDNLIEVNPVFNVIGNFEEVKTECDRVVERYKHMEHFYYDYESWKRIHKENEEE